MRKAQAQLAARQRLLQDKILEERERAAALAALENTRVQRKLEAAEKTLTELLKPQQAAKSATATELKRKLTFLSKTHNVNQRDIANLLATFHFTHREPVSTVSRRRYQRS